MTSLADFLEEQALERQVHEMERSASLSDFRPVDQDLLDAAMQGKLTQLEVALARGASVDAVERRVSAPAGCDWPAFFGRPCRDPSYGFRAAVLSLWRASLVLGLGKFACRRPLPLAAGGRLRARAQPHAPSPTAAS